MPLSGVSTRSQRSPPSWLRQTPPSSTPNQTCSWRDGSTQMVRMRGRFTPWQNSGNSRSSVLQLAPPSRERYMRARAGAPVPA